MTLSQSSIMVTCDINVLTVTMKFV